MHYLYVMYFRVLQVVEQTEITVDPALQCYVLCVVDLARSIIINNAICIDHDTPFDFFSSLFERETLLILMKVRIDTQKDHAFVTTAYVSCKASFGLRMPEHTTGQRYLMQPLIKDNQKYFRLVRTYVMQAMEEAVAVREPKYFKKIARTANVPRRMEEIVEPPSVVLC
jgi:hypothetical protein